jgi:hypothetical protein
MGTERGSRVIPGVPSGVHPAGSWAFVVIIKTNNNDNEVISFFMVND